MPKQKKPKFKTLIIALVALVSLILGIDNREQIAGGFSNVRGFTTLQGTISDFDKISDSATLDANWNIASAGFNITWGADTLFSRTVSVSLKLEATGGIQVGPNTASVGYSRFGSDATGHSLSALDDLLVSGLVEFNDQVFFDEDASISGAFSVSGKGLFGSLVASSSNLDFEIVSTGTTSIGFEGEGAFGTCFEVRAQTGELVYMRFTTSTVVVNTTSCK